MIRILRYVLPVAALLAVSSCAVTVPKVHQVQVDEGRLNSGRAMPKLACNFRLVRVDDHRPDNGDSGRLSLNVLHLEDAPGVVTRQLHALGLQPADAATGRDVVIDLKQMYMTQQLEVKIPVVVYGVQVAGDAPYLVRSDSSTLNWWGSKGEAQAGYARALADANSRLINSLNLLCR